MATPAPVNRQSPPAPASNPPTSAGAGAGARNSSNNPSSPNAPTLATSNFSAARPPSIPNPNVSGANLSSASSTSAANGKRSGAGSGATVTSTRSPSQKTILNLHAVFMCHATSSPSTSTAHTTDTDTDNEFSSISQQQPMISIHVLRTLFEIDDHTPFEQRQRFQNAVTLAVSQPTPTSSLSSHPLSSTSVDTTATPNQKVYFNQIDKLSFHQFVNFFIALHAYTDTSSNLTQLFSYLDPDGDGLVTPTDLCAILSSKYALFLSPDQAHAMTDYITSSLDSPYFNRQQFSNFLSSIASFAASDESS